MDLLSVWDGNMDKKSIEASIFAVWENFYLKSFLPENHFSDLPDYVRTPLIEHWCFD